MPALSYHPGSFHSSTMCPFCHSELFLGPSNHSNTWNSWTAFPRETVSLSTGYRWRRGYERAMASRALRTSEFDKQTHRTPLITKLI